MNRNLIYLSFIFIFFIGCKKGTDDPVIPADPAKLIITSYTTIAAGSGVYNLIAYNADKSVKWSRTGIAPIYPTYPLYHNGLLYVSPDLGPLHALQIETGNNAWTYGTTNYYSTPAVKDNVLYVASSDRKVHAIDAVSGAGLWTLTVNDLVIKTPVMLQNTLFVMSAPVSTAVYSLHAIDINTRAVRWSKVIGVNPPSAVVSGNDCVYLSAANGTLLALNSIDGSVKWSKPGLSTSNPVLSGNSVYITSASGLYAFDGVTGTQLWHYPVGTFGWGGRNPYIRNNKVYVLNSSEAVLNFESSTGTLIWQKANTESYESPPVVSDDMLIATRQPFQAGGAATTAVMIMDISSGTKKDSILIPPAVNIGAAYILTNAGKWLYPN
ncbi:MAG TPA: PQQ-binding-like beta-propeller repeat protein [Chitinophagaceae bacterium]|nr:PQQ-binding-like beta-propeller repeat protein [Chitinophagaceae bacterium]HQZ75244.1 PQQ-binding-like beta-propeller repeat protein [Chitinophagaceae bacterium]